MAHDACHPRDAYVYANEDDCFILFPDGPEISPEALRTASRHVDALTYGRIRQAGGFGNLTKFQQDVVREVVCRQAAFEVENADAINSGVSSYSINGVSMQFGEGWNVIINHGVAMQRDVYELLEQTGLCCLLAR